MACEKHHINPEYEGLCIICDSYKRARMATELPQPQVKPGSQVELKKKCCSEPDCVAMRNALADAYEIVTKALEEICAIEDRMEYGRPPCPDYWANRAISIAGNARREAMYHLVDERKKLEGIEG